MGYSQGVGGEGQLFPLSEHCSPLSTATFLVPPKYFTALAPYISHSPLGTSSERAMVLRSETGYKEFSGNKVQLFLNFFFYVLQKREKERGTTAWLWTIWGAQQPQPFAPSENVFPWSALHASALLLAEGWTLVSRDVLMKLSLYIAWSQTPCPIQRSHKG